MVYGAVDDRGIVKGGRGHRLMNKWYGGSLLHKWMIGEKVKGKGVHTLMAY
jgi:hypothetical protein